MERVGAVSLMNGKVLVGGILFGIVALSAVFAPWLPLASPDVIDVKAISLGPSPAYPLGTNIYGEDNLSRAIHGGRLSILVGMAATLISMGLGVPTGLVGAVLKGRWEAGLMRAVDVLLSIPPIVMAMVVVALLGGSATNLIISLGLIYSPHFARVCHAAASELTAKDFVVAAHAIGASPSRIIWKHVFMNMVPPIVGQTVVTLGFMVFAEAGLSFIGLGPPPPAISWGRTVAIGVEVANVTPWVLVSGSLPIALTILALNTLGDGLRLAMTPGSEPGRPRLPGREEP